MQSENDQLRPQDQETEQWERELINEVKLRREKAEVENEPSGAWAISLSGGGIRSATFCLGLVRGLARSGMLKRFDYLSTVSGGGYLGASLGRLYNSAVTPTSVELGVASQKSMWLWWLRNNGRYLTPAGARDLGYASASILRGVIATHIEIAIIVLTLAALALLPHFLASLFPPLNEGGFWSRGVLNALPSVWAWLMILPAWACFYQLSAYWYTRDQHSSVSISLILLSVIACGAIAWKAGFEAQQSSSAFNYAVCVLLTAPIAALMGLASDVLRRTSTADQRLARTKRLSYGLWGLGICSVLVLLDWSTWQLTRLYWGDQLHQAAYRVLGATLLLTAIGRLALPELQRWMATIKGPGLNIQRALNILGILISISVAVFWTSVLSIAIFHDDSRMVFWDPTWTNLHDIPPVRYLALVLFGCLAYLLATRRSFDLLNLASLHNFYRARIERAYVSSGNINRQSGRFATPILNPVTSASTNHVAPLTEVVKDDDVDLLNYSPHTHGGPIHLINCCINQCVDDRTGLYNADRKGIALTLSSLGVEVGTQFPEPPPNSATIGSLSKWIAISGAAASTGMGSRTSPGFAALLFMSGIRLGYWTHSLIARNPNQRSSGLRASLVRWMPKPLAIVSESLARFPGLSSPSWYVSDGGHFDNTGIYALLKRRPSVILAADCGADPKYLFGDLESLVRKAQIDYGATIEFVPNSPALPPTLAQAVGTPETIQPTLGSQWMVLGRITYVCGKIGTLIVVKPRRLDAMPFDLVAYADRNPDFPQQTTGDQFFDESQWESYHQLGLLLGERITDILVQEAVKTTHGALPAHSSLVTSERLAAELKAKMDRSERAQFTVRATLGAGISLSLAVAAWQGFEQFRESRRSEDRLYKTDISSLSTKVQEDEIDPLLKNHLVDFANESTARGDGSIKAILDQLDSRCGRIEDKKIQGDCAKLHSDIRLLVTENPKPFYDYWFLDKLDAYNDTRGQSGSNASATEFPPIPTKGNAGHMPGYSASVTSGSSSSSNCVPALLKTNEELSRCADQQGASATPSPTNQPAVTDRACAPTVRVFVHIYDEESRGAAELDGLALMKVVGARRAPVENVVATATRFGRSSPYTWRKPTLVYPAGTSPACIDAATKLFGENLSSQKIGSGTANSLELWLPPRTLSRIPQLKAEAAQPALPVQTGSAVVIPPQPPPAPRIDHLPLVRYAPGRLQEVKSTPTPVFNQDAIQLNSRQIAAVKIYWTQLTKICDMTTQPAGRIVVYGFASDDPVLDSRGKATGNRDELNLYLSNMRALGLASILEDQIKNGSTISSVEVVPHVWQRIVDMRSLRDKSDSLAAAGSGHSSTQDYRSATVSLSEFRCVARAP